MTERKYVYMLSCHVISNDQVRTMRYVLAMLADRGLEPYERLAAAMEMSGVTTKALSAVIALGLFDVRATSGCNPFRVWWVLGRDVRVSPPRV